MVPLIVPDCCHSLSLSCSQCFAVCACAAHTILVVHQTSTWLSLIASQLNFRCCLMARHSQESYDLALKSSAQFC